MQRARDDHAPDAPTALTVDDDAAPLAVTGDPGFGWQPVDRDYGETQTAYQLQVFDEASADAGHRIADTQQVHSDQQSYVRVPALASQLRPDRRYWWNVRTWDRDGHPGAYSALAHFDTGLGDRDWKASWIRRPGAERAALEDYSLFRRVVRVGPSPITRARVYASAGHQYDLRVNGVRLAHGPSFAYPDEQYYQATDVTKSVRAGAANVFAFVTWWGQPGQGRPASVPALIAQISIDHADGSREVIVTNSKWRAHAGPWKQGHQRNDEGDFVEHIDERQALPGWDSPAAASDDRGWVAAAVVGPAGTAPFTHLVAARTHIVEQRRAPVSLRRVGTGWVADFGAIISATPVVELHNGRAGAAITLVGGDALDPDGHVSSTNGIQDTDMTWDFDARAGAQELRPFGYLAFRYLEVDGASEPLTPADVQIDARHASFPNENAGQFGTDSAALNNVWNLARHSALYDSQEQFLDTPTREKGPFLGDSFDVSQAAMAAFGDRALTFQALRDFARSQTRYWPDGRVNVVYPNGDGKRDIPDATQTYVEWVWQNWVTTGNREQLASLYPVVLNITDYVARAIDKRTGLVTYLPGGGSDYQNGAVDWPPAMRYGYDMNTAARTMMNVLAVDDFRRVAAMADALGRPRAESVRQTARADALVKAIRSRLTRPDGILIDGLEANGAQSTHASQQANAWALAFGVVPAAHTKAVADYIVSLKNAMGVVYFRVLLDALHRAGRDDALIASLTDPGRPGYANMLQRGATFTWESWNAPDVGDSESHGWGSTVLAVLQDDILGVRAVEPGAARLDVRIPHTTLANASGVVATQRGPVPIKWTHSGTTDVIELSVPDNVTAVVHLTASDVGHVANRSRPLAGAPGVEGVSRAGNEVLVTIGSGTYVLANTAPLHGAGASSTWHTGLILAAAGVFLVLAGIVVLLVRRRSRAGQSDRMHV